MNTTLLSYRWSDELRRPWFSLRHQSYPTPQKINFFHKQSQFKLGSVHHFYKYTISVGAKQQNKIHPGREIDELFTWLPFGTLTDRKCYNSLLILFFFKEIIFEDDHSTFSRSYYGMYLRNYDFSMVDDLYLIIIRYQSDILKNFFDLHQRLGHARSQKVWFQMSTPTALAANPQSSWFFLDWEVIQAPSFF